VKIVNQFSRESGDQILTLGRSHWLLVPTRKLAPRLHPTPEGLDHFKCYFAEGAAANVPVRLIDEFRQVIPQLTVGEPRALCNPVDKKHEGKESLRQHPRDHLVCYELQHPTSVTVEGENQFGRVRLDLDKLFGLCVPSTKEVLPEEEVPQG